MIRHGFVTAVVLLFAVACGGDSTSPPPDRASVARVVVTPSSTSVEVGRTTQLAASPMDASGSPLAGRTIAWSTSSASVAIVSPNGVVTAVTPGTVTITASSEGASGAADVTITQPAVARVAVTLERAISYVGETAAATAITTDSVGQQLTGRPIAWSSSNASVATVAVSGAITAIAPGTTTVSASSEGKSGSALVTVLPASTLQVGANIISVGNQYLTAPYDDANIATLLSTLQTSRFRYISIRVIWSIMEPTQGQYNQVALARLDKIMTEADRMGFGVMLDFHTLFNDRDQSWQAPAWLPGIAPAVSINGESLPRGSMRHIFYTAAVRDAYSAMQQHVTARLKDHPSLKYISLLNEPYLTYNSDTNDQYFSPTIATLIARLRTVTTRPMSFRMLPGWNPWADDPRKRIGATVWPSLDYLAVNIYPDPFDDAEIIDGTVGWRLLVNMRSASRAAGKKFVISEIGTTNTSSAERERFWVALFSVRFLAIQPDVVMPWNVQNDGDFYPATANSFNLLRASNSFAAYASSSILPFLR